MNHSSADARDPVLAGNVLRWQPFGPFAKKPELATQISLLQASVAHEPHRTSLRCGLAVLLADVGREQEALEQWRRAAQISPQEPAIRYGLAKALLSCRRALEAIALLEGMRDEIGGAAADFDLTYGRALAQTGRHAHALAIYRQRLESNPTNDDALYRATRLLILAKNAAGALSLIDSLQARGVCTTRMLVEKVTVLRLLDRHAEAAALEGIEHFLQTGLLPVPEGWQDRGALNAALTTELNAHPGRRFENPRRRTRGGWRIDALNVPTHPALQALFISIRAYIDEYVERMQAAAPHPFLDLIPESARLTTWAIWLRENAHQEWHVHPHGWLSGVYYVTVPEGAVGTQGALVLGTPKLPDVATALPGYCTWHVPRSGELVLFPSHCYHRTLPSKVAADRISIAFDVIDCGRGR
jgi:uncharacterized protein (TIGR02466 family)